MGASNPEFSSALADRYELQGVLGEGGMGTVYLAQDLKHDRPVAIKTIRAEIATDVIQARFEREIRITAHLQHPHILPLLDSGVAAGTLFYVMPHVDGESLRARLDRAGALPIEQVISMAEDVAEGLEHAHAQGVVHRDIKPDNILLADGYALILDFGIATALADIGGDTLTKTGLWIGSPNYMAPEQLEGVTSPRTDLYALGCVLYEAATGHRRTTTQSGWGEIPEHLRQTIEKATRPAPAERWEDADAFRAALRSGGRAARGARRAAIPLAIAAAAMVVAALLFALGPFGGSGARALSDFESVAVLPLANLTGDPEEHYFVAGMHEAVISELAQVQDLRVVSRTSVARYADTQLSIPEIGEALGVAAVLEGGVRRLADRVLVDVRLIDAAADRHLWAERYDEVLSAENLFTIQTSLAEKVAIALEAAFEPAGSRVPPTESLAAYDLYARGRYLYNRFASYEDRERALGLFHEAIAIDSSYARAYVALAEAYAFLGAQGYLSREEALPAARVAAERALALDETLAEAHAALGSVLAGEGRNGPAEREFRRAIDLDPSSADVRRQFGRLLNRTGRTNEAVDQARLAVELDPLSVGNRVSLASRLFYARDYAGVISEATNVLEMEPNDVGALFFLGGAYMLVNQHQDGLAALRKARELDPDNPFRVTMLAWAYARAGQRAPVTALIEHFDVQGELLKELAIVYAELGEIDQAFAYFERAADEDPRSLMRLRTDPTADALLADPRVEASLQLLEL